MMSITVKGAKHMRKRMVLTIRQYPNTTVSQFSDEQVELATALLNCLDQHAGNIVTSLQQVGTIIVAVAAVTPKHISG